MKYSVKVQSNFFFNSTHLKLGFTLIEILIVVALLAILAVIALRALNPGAAQDRTRDAQRFKDAISLQAIVEQLLFDNPIATTNRVSTANGKSNACGSQGWLGTDVCSYAKIVPIDPLNKTQANYYSAGATSPSTGTVAYQVIIGGGKYRICTRIQAKSNIDRLTSDGGNSDKFFEIYNNTSSTTNCTLP